MPLMCVLASVAIGVFLASVFIFPTAVFRISLFQLNISHLLGILGSLLVTFVAYAIGLFIAAEIRKG